MANASGQRLWGAADAYEAYMGRWSRPLARAFLAWLALPTRGRWLDVGCGTGALTAAILEMADPSAVVGIDPSPDFVSTARTRIRDGRARFEIGDALALPVATGNFDTVAAGLVLNHVPDSSLAVREMVRATRPGGTVGGYVWDYQGEMQMIRLFWEAAAATDPAAATHDPRAGYHICQPAPLAALFRETRLDQVAVDAIDVPMTFPDFDDLWLPHTLAGPAAPQRYVAGLVDEQLAKLRDQLQGSLPIAADGTIALIGRAWVVRGTKPTA